MSENRFTLIGSFATAAEAHIVAGRLASVGIDAQVRDEHLVNSFWLYSQAIGGVRVLVPTEQAEQARALLAEDAQHALQESNAPAFSDLRCPHCGSSELYYFRRSWGTVLSWLLLGLPLLLPKGRLRCESCGHSFKASA